MKENLQILLQSLRAEQQTLERQRSDLSNQLDAAIDSRRLAARQCIRSILPNLMPDTISSLRKAVPGFEIPMVSTWLGFIKKLDPNVTIDTLRIQLGTYLDNVPGASREWEHTVGRHDQVIRSLQEKSIPENTVALNEVSTKIEALKKFSAIDPNKMSPETRKKIEQAIASARKTGGRNVSFMSMQKNPRVAPSYPTQSQISSNSGPSLLEMWLWYQLLTPHSEYSHGVPPAVVGGGGELGGGGEFAGGGAGGSWEEPKDASGVSAGSAVSGNIEPHYALGAATFS
jgi:hypothetical protein